MPQKIAAGNWKMNGTLDALPEAAAIAGGASEAIQIVLCPPATLLGAMASAAQGTGLALGGQYCHANASGAHTGDLAAEMLADAGARYCITGHSERRQDHGETDADVRAQTEAAWRAGLVAILCIGETLEEREDGRTMDVLLTQLAGSLPEGADTSNTVIAYEPVWAIGTGKVATPDQVDEVHNNLREWLGEKLADGMEMSLLYGGSVKAGNAAELFALPNVNGGLVGGASLKADDFLPIAEALAAS